MSFSLIEYISNVMIKVPAGSVELRDYKDNVKWLSSNHRMSVPGRQENSQEVLWNEEVEAIYISKYMVTQDLYDYVNNEKYEFVENRLPVVEVSWLEAIKFCNQLSRQLKLEECYTITDVSKDIVYRKPAVGIRLLTDAEWQHACRAGSTGYRYDDIDLVAWYRDNSEGRLHEVGELKPNNWGLYDMLGNAWEWCWDLYDVERYDNYRIFRGGSWAEEERGCGSTVRRKSMPDFRIDDLGFRIAISAKYCNL